MKINPKENIYFAIKLIISILLYSLLVYTIYIVLSSDDAKTQALFWTIFIYAALIILFFLIQTGIMIGHLKGNAIKITPKQFPDIYEVLAKESQTLGLKRIPDAYVWQRGGLLNAFTLRFIGTHYVVVYSDVLAEAYKKDKATVAFIIGHELGHVKRRHFVKKLFLLPSSLIPFLGAAYSRACEYTADNFGAFLSPDGAVTGIMLLAAGPHLTAKVDATQFTIQEETEGGFWHWFSEKVASHPNLTKRVIALRAIYPEKPKTVSRSSFVPVETTEEKPAQSSDHSKYMPN